MENPEDHIEINLLHKYVVGETNKEESNKVEEWISSSDTIRSEYEALKRIWGKSSKVRQLPDIKINTDVAWSKVRNHIRKSSLSEEVIEEKKLFIPPAEVKIKSKKPFSPFYRIAALLVLGLGLSWLVYFFVASNQNLQVAEAQNERLEIVLPDGSKITLNRNSRLSWSEDDFGKETRAVELQGEAFFEVTSDKTKPFIVKTTDLNIQVVGTTFVINTQSEKVIAEVAVKSGSVMVYNTKEDLIKPEKKIILSKGEKAVLKDKDHTPEKVLDTDANIFSFKTKQLLFEGLPLEQVVLELEEYYGIPFSIESDELKSQKLSARFNDKPLENVLEVLELTFDLEARKEDGKIVLQEKIYEGN